MPQMEGGLDSIPVIGPILRSIIDGVTWEVLKLILEAITMTAVGSFILKFFKRIEGVKELVVISLAGFVFLFILLFSVSPRVQSPKLAGGILNAVAGPLNNNRDTIAVITMNVLNAGSMQSIVKNWSVSVNINNTKYPAQFIIPAPKQFTFNSLSSSPGAATGITYKGEDNLLEKGMTSIQPGGMASGVLFVLFGSLDANVLKPGAEYVVEYEDINSTKYSARIRSTAIPADIATVPGLHSELMCPAAGSPKPAPPANNLFTPG
jgi:type 1 fimbria pilin